MKDVVFYFAEGDSFFILTLVFLLFRYFYTLLEELVYGHSSRLYFVQKVPFYSKSTISAMKSDPKREI